MAISTLLNINSIHPFLLILLTLLSFLILRSRRAGLDNLPGPFLARYTDAWRAYQAWKTHGTGTNYQRRMYQEHGDVVRIGPCSVLVNDPEAIPTILGIKARLNKGPGYIAFQQPGAPPSIVRIFDEQAHSKLRRPINHAYTLSALKGYEPYIDEMINKLAHAVEGHADKGARINMGAWMHYWSYDVIGKLSFGEPIGFLDYGSDFIGMIQAQRDFSKYVETISNWPILHPILHGRSLLSPFKKTPSVFSLFARRIVRERLTKARSASDEEKETQQFPDFLSKFIAAQKSHPDVVTDTQITIFSTSNVIAGSLATSQVIATVMTYLSTHLSAQDALFHDIIQTETEEATAMKDAIHSQHEDNESKAKEEEDSGSAALSLALKIPALEALILESYRLHRNLSTNLERVVSSSGLTLPSGQRLPPGTLVSMNASTLGRRKDVYGPDAETFNPARWMRRDGEGEEEFQKRKAWMNHCMVQFGHGSRSCMGKNLVQLEMFKVLATLLGRYKFEAVGEWKPHELWVNVSKRQKV